MNIFLIIIITVLIFLLFYTALEYKKIKLAHDVEISNLNLIITDLLSIQNKQNSAVKLSNDLKLKLQNSRVTIDKNLLNLQNELIQTLKENNLVD